VNGSISKTTNSEWSGEQSVELSVIVVPFAGAPFLDRCLRSLEGQSHDGPFEVIVPCDTRKAGVGELAKVYPFVRFVPVEGPRSPAALRAIGVHNAKGAIIAITEDHCTVESDWCSSIVEAHERLPVSAVGGAVDPGDLSILARATFLADYGRYCRTSPERPATSITDINSSYKRWALAAVAELWEDEFHEPAINETLLARGASIWFSPKVVVRQARSLSARAAIHDRFAFGRLFASGRVRGSSLVKRIALAFGAFVLPLALLGRIVRQEAESKVGVLRMLPALVVLSVAWSFGEFVGYATGRPPRRLGEGS